MAVYQGDIPISNNFQVNTPRPIDPRGQVPTHSDLVLLTNVYSGLRVWVINEQNYYRLQNDLVTWTLDNGFPNPIPQSFVQNLLSTLATFISTAIIGVANGVASLDNNIKVPVSQLQNIIQDGYTSATQYTWSINKIESEIASSTINVVNNLTTNSATEALSAEQGMYIWEQVTLPTGIADLSIWTTFDCQNAPYKTMTVGGSTDSFTFGGFINYLNGGVYRIILHKNYVDDFIIYLPSTPWDFVDANNTGQTISQILVRGGIGRYEFDFTIDDQTVYSLPIYVYVRGISSINDASTASNNQTWSINEIKSNLLSLGSLENTLYVDLNGTNSSLRKTNIINPYLNVDGTNGANNSAVAGDTVIFLPGNHTFQSNNLISNGINYHFENGAIISYNGSVPNGYPFINDASGPIVSNITGKLGGSGTMANYLALLTNPSSNVYLEFLNLIGRSASLGLQAYIEIGGSASMVMKGVSITPNVGFGNIIHTGGLGTNTGGNLIFETDYIQGIGSANNITINTVSGNYVYIKIKKSLGGKILINCLAGSYVYLDIDEATFNWGASSSPSAPQGTLEIVALSGLDGTGTSVTGGTVYVKGKYKFITTSLSDPSGSNPAIYIGNSSVNFTGTTILDNVTCIALRNNSGTITSVAGGSFSNNSSNTIILGTCIGNSPLYGTTPSGGSYVNVGSAINNLF